MARARSLRWQHECAGEAWSGGGGSGSGAGFGRLICNWVYGGKRDAGALDDGRERSSYDYVPPMPARRTLAQRAQQLVFAGVRESNCLAGFGRARAGGPSSLESDERRLHCFPRDCSCAKRVTTLNQHPRNRRPATANMQTTLLSQSSDTARREAERGTAGMRSTA